MGKREKEESGEKELWDREITHMAEEQEEKLHLSVDEGVGIDVAINLIIYLIPAGREMVQCLRLGPPRVNPIKSQPYICSILVPIRCGHVALRSGTKWVGRIFFHQKVLIYYDK